MKGTLFARGMVWDTGTLAWVKNTTGGGGGGGLTNVELRAAPVDVNVQNAVGLMGFASRVNIADASSDPSGSENALIVRNIPSGTQAVSFQGVLPTANHATWTLGARPGAAAQATATKAAAGPGVSNVVTGFTFSLAIVGTAQAAALQVDIIDGASGGGTRLWSGVLGGGAVNSNQQISVMGCYLKGTPNTALTIEFSGAGAAGTIQACSAQGFITV